MVATTTITQLQLTTYNRHQYAMVSFEKSWKFSHSPQTTRKVVRCTYVQYYVLLLLLLPTTSIYYVTYFFELPIPLVSAGLSVCHINLELTTSSIQPWIADSNVVRITHVIRSRINTSSRPAIHCHTYHIYIYILYIIYYDLEIDLKQKVMRNKTKKETEIEREITLCHCSAYKEWIQ